MKSDEANTRLMKSDEANAELSAKPRTKSGNGFETLEKIQAIVSTKEKCSPPVLSPNTPHSSSLGEGSNQSL